MPPMAGLQLICAIRSRFMVTMAVRRPMREQARAASQPAWPAPMTTTSYRSGIATIVRGMKILVIGSGGREHALCWKLAQSEEVEVFACPGNPGMARVATCVPGEPLDAALRTAADLTVVGPEVPLVAGVVDAFRARGLRIVGPNAEAARLEGSKGFAKDFFQQRGIPTAAYTVVEDASHARMALGRFGFPVVLKADGLAAGKGVVVAHNAAEAEAALGTLNGSLGTPFCTCPAKAGRTHLGHANVLGPGNDFLLPGAEFTHLEVSARTLQPMILQHFPGLLPVGQAGEPALPPAAQPPAPTP